MRALLDLLRALFIRPDQLSVPMQERRDLAGQLAAVTAERDEWRRRALAAEKARRPGPSLLAEVVARLGMQNTTERELLREVDQLVALRAEIVDFDSAADPDDHDTPAQRAAHIRDALADAEDKHLAFHKAVCDALDLSGMETDGSVVHRVRTLWAELGRLRAEHAARGGRVDELLRLGTHLVGRLTIEGKRIDDEDVQSAIAAMRHEIALGGTA